MKNCWIFLLFLFPNMLWGQSDTLTPEQKINIIKKDTSYVFSESTTKEWDDALENAKVLLNHNVEMWLSKIGKKDSSYIEKVGKYTRSIQGRRGVFYRAFVFVNKKDVVRLNSDKTLTNTAHDVSDSDANTVVKELVAEKCILSRSLTIRENEFLTVSSAQDALTYIRQLQGQHVVTQMGKYKDRPTGVSYYLFVYDKSMSIKTVMYFDGEIYYNLNTLECEEMSRYKGCGGVWFQLQTK